MAARALAIPCVQGSDSAEAPDFGAFLAVGNARGKVMSAKKEGPFTSVDRSISELPGSSRSGMLSTAPMPVRRSIERVMTTHP